MQAILFAQPGPPESLHLATYERPVPGPRHLLVAVAATAVNRADILQRQGRYPEPPGESPILGLEMSGTVVGTGAGVVRWQVGDQVCGLLAGGGYAEYAVIHEDMALPIPTGVDLMSAAAIPEVFLTAYQALHWLADLQPGERVLIHAGASGVGTAAIQLARDRGAEVLVTASAPKHALCHRLGADRTIDYRTESFFQVVQDHTRGRGVDVIIDFLAAPYFEANLQSLATDGRLVLLGLMGGSKVPEVNLSYLLRKRLQLIGSTLRNRSLDYKVRLTQALHEAVWPRFAAGSVVPVIDRVLPWQQAAEAHRLIEANRTAGKIVLRVGG